MTRHHDGPRAGSLPYQALASLFSAGGKATATDWMASTAWPKGMSAFEDEIVHVLIARGKVYVRGTTVAITDDGLAHLGIEPDAPAAEVALPVAPRYVPPFKPLVAVPARLRAGREGEFDYLAIPSLVGNQRIERKTCLSAQLGDRAA